MSKKRVILFKEENNSIYDEIITSIDEVSIETKNNLYPRKDFIQYFDETNNSLVFISKIDVAAKIESENLKKLRRSSALNNLFNYETSKEFDLMVYMPYIIIIIMAIFM